MPLLQTELGQPSIIQPAFAFAGVKLLLVEPDTIQAQMTRKLLFGLGCQKTVTVRSAEEALEVMMDEAFDIVLTGWDMKHMSGIDFTLLMRNMPESPNRTIPIVMMSNRASVQDVLHARDCGINEYVARPFSPRALLERFYALAEQPRSFVLCDSFSGPDRRRSNPVKKLINPSSKKEYKRRPPLLVSKETLSQIDVGDTPYMIMPDYTLKEKVGLYVPEEIKQLTSFIETESDRSDVEFIETMLKETEILQRVLHKLQRSPEFGEHARKQLMQTAFIIKTYALTRRYECAAEVAELLHGFCLRYFRTDDVNHHIIIEKHIESLQVIFYQDYRENAGKTGELLLLELARLIQKYLMH